MKNLVPYYIIEKTLSGESEGHFNAVTLFIDICGFTKMTNEFMKYGNEGIEVLSSIINSIFKPSIDMIYDNNGFVSTFAGDAFTVVFEESKIENILQPLFAAKSINSMLSKLITQNTKFGSYELLIKMGISYGEVKWGIIRNDIQDSYFFKGLCIDKCAFNEQNATGGEIILDDELLSWINSSRLKTEKKSEGIFLLEEIDFSPSCKSEDKAYDRSILERFYPQTVVESEFSGEFREVISCFISIMETDRITEIVSSIITLATEYGGYFNKVDFGDKGIIALVVFGAPIGREKIFERACDFSLNLLEIDGLKCRIGITYGKVYAGFIGSKRRCEYTIIGMGVNLSARLALAAQPYEIYIDKHTYNHVKSSYYVEYLEDKMLKGFVASIPAYKLSGKKELCITIDAKGTFIGREEYLKKLLEFVKVIDDNKFGGIVYVDGQAGMGKSRLILELKQRLDDRYTWMFMPCDGILRKSFNPVVSFLSSYFNQKENETYEKNRMLFSERFDYLFNATKDFDIKKELLRTKSFLEGLLEIQEKDSLFEKIDAKERYENILYTVKNLIKAESKLKPVIIELEDGHWIDNDTKKILEVLTRNVDDFPFMIIAACRYNDDGSLFSFGLNDVKEEAISLDSLDESMAKALIISRLTENAEIARDNLEYGAVKYIQNQCGGNPFYIEQLVLYLKENHLLDESYNLRKQDIDIPSNINEIIIARIDRLETDLKEAVKTASVLGMEVIVNVLNEMLKNHDVLKNLCEGEKENIWSKVTELKYIFKHALIRDSVYQMQLKGRLRELHKLAAEVMEIIYRENLVEHYKDIAYHFEKSEVMDKTIDYLMKAADYASENYKNDEALSLYDKLIAYTSDNEVALLEGLIGKAKVLRNIGKYLEGIENAEKSLLLAEKMNDKKKMLNARKLLGILYSGISNFDASMENSNAALLLAEKLNDFTGMAQVFINIGTIYEIKRDYEKAQVYNYKALVLSIKHNIREYIGSAYENIATVYFKKQEIEKSYENAIKALDIMEELGNKTRLAHFYNILGAILIHKDDDKKGVDYLYKALDINEEIGNVRGLANLYNNLGIYYTDKSEYEKALDHFIKSLKIKEEIDDLKGVRNTNKNIGIIYKDKSDYRQVIHYFKRAAEINRKIGLNKDYVLDLIEIAITNLKINEIREAFKIIMELIEMMKEVKNKHIDGSFHMTIAIILSKIEENENDENRNFANVLSEKMGLGISPEPYFNYALKILEKEDYYSNYVLALVEHARYNYKKGKKTAAKIELDKARQIAKKTGLSIEIREVEKVFRELGIE
ncbi:MAG: tetratricopeptide repeat protein [Candidatus Coatesbacteria bacterium]|nr:tetratricopeptide repeat protein [Candidatus Coatesbacteria bacterium]